MNAVGKRSETNRARLTADICQAAGRELLQIASTVVAHVLRFQGLAHYRAESLTE
jgi:hypothetical protein